MHVVPYHSGYLASVVGLYNQMTKGVPHCHPITPSDLAEAFNGGCGIESDGRKMRKEAILVAVEDEPIGFVHVGEGITPEKLGIEGVQGNIRFLCYPRGRRDVGQLLLEHAEAWVRDAGLDSMLVYRQNYRYPFYHFAHAFISNHLEHVQALLLLNEYVTCGGEVFLDWPNMAPTRPSGSGGLEVDLKVVHTSGSGRLPDLELKAYLQGEEIGQCQCINGGSFTRDPGAEGWIFTKWLGVSDAYQGRGLGRYLLGNALCEARSLGYRHAAISTDIDNHRALLFYANFGYHAVDWTRQFLKPLPPRS